MFFVEYGMLVLVILFEIFCITKYLVRNKFEKTDIYVTQFLVAGVILLILSNIILLFTWNITKNKIYITSITRAVYVLLYCTSLPFISSYIFNHISISKRVDIGAHVILIIGNLVPVIMIVLIPVYLNGRGASLSLQSLLSVLTVAPRIDENSFMNSYLYLIEYDQSSPYFGTTLCLSWITVLSAYLFIIISLVITKKRIKAQRIEHYYLFLITLVYIGLTLCLLSSPALPYSFLVYHLRQVLEVTFFFVLSRICNKQTAHIRTLGGIKDAK